jgi:hypothetical protein
MRARRSSASGVARECERVSMLRRIADSDMRRRVSSESVRPRSFAAIFSRRALSASGVVAAGITVILPRKSYWLGQR